MALSTPPDRHLKKTVLDKDLKKIGHLEQATRQQSRHFMSLGLALVFLVAVWAFVSAITGQQEHGVFIIIAGVIGGYMALNIGANDVANNVGPAVGSKALTMFGALIIAAIFEAAGAIIAGGEVVSTISKGIIDPKQVEESLTFILAMTAALLSAALWVNLATWIGAPVSTTHAIVGGVMGAGIAAAGFGAVNWPTMGAIAASWVVSPILGGGIAAAFLYFIKLMILEQEDKLSAAKRWVPVLIAIMAAAFAAYLTLKGFKHIWKPPMWAVYAISFGALVGGWAVVRPLVIKAAGGMENRRKAVARLFTLPLIGSAALLSFAHGANDVANAVGPLAAVVSTVTTGTVATKVGIPLWVMVVGAIGISAGLVLFGPKLIRTVGEKITKLDPIRAYCVALSAAITVIAASWLGLPVSSTHIAVGGVFGVGFLREYRVNQRRQQAVMAAEAQAEKEVQLFEANAALAHMTPEEREAHLAEKRAKKILKAKRRRLVRRQHMMTIGAAWVITVPAAAVLSAILFYVLRAANSG